MGLWHRGYPEQARRALDEGIRDARESVHRRALAYSLIYKGLTATSARWVAETEEAADGLVSHTREHGFALFFGYGLLLQGGALTLRGQGEAAVEQIHEAVAATHATGIRRYDPMVLGFLAEALALKGLVAEGLRTLTAALAAAEVSGTHWADAELHRLRGGLLGRLPANDWTEVETCFRTALSIAREQGTRGFELRAALSLAGLLNEQGRRDEALELLVPVYGCFTEGFDTPVAFRAITIYWGALTRRAENLQCAASPSNAPGIPNQSLASRQFARRSRCYPDRMGAAQFGVLRMQTCSCYACLG